MGVVYRKQYVFNEEDLKGASFLYVFVFVLFTLNALKQKGCVKRESGNHA